MIRASITYIALLVAAVSGSVASDETQRLPFTIEDIFAEGGITGSEPTSVNWRPDSKGFSFLLADHQDGLQRLWYVDAENGDKRLLLDARQLQLLTTAPAMIKDERERERITRHRVSSYQWSPDSRKLLFDAGGRLWLYDLTKGSPQELRSGTSRLEDAQFSPSGGRIAFVSEHDLYLISVATRSSKRLTWGGTADLLNGDVDMLYAEQFDVRSGYRWSPSSAEIAFLEMNEKRVPSYPIIDWGPKHPTVTFEKYPKAGDPNPRVRLGIVDARSGNTRFFRLSEDDSYVPRFGWVREGLLWAEVLNRRQDHLGLYFVDLRSGKMREVLSETAKNAWVNAADVSFMEREHHFIWSSWRTESTQLFLYRFDDQHPLRKVTLVRQLTSVEFGVLGTETPHTDNNLYFTSNIIDPKQRHLFRVGIDGGGLRQVSREDGWHKAQFAPDGRHYLDTFSSLLLPPQLSLCGPTGECRMIWQSHPLADGTLIVPSFLEFKGADGTQLWGELLLPLPPTPRSKIPVVVYVYGGPDHQIATNAWSGPVGLFHQVLASHGIAVFMVDNRGTPGRDKKFQTAIWHEFGQVELDDQLTALDQVLARYPQLDPTRVGIWGWSNGGSLALYAVTHCERFSTGIAVAPVTDWRNYASAYAERYLGLPNAEPRPYEDTILKSVAHLHGNLTIVHGTADNNVHFQNTVQLMQSLVEAGKQFRALVYPNKTHGIAGQAYRSHLFHAIERQFENDLSPNK